MDTAASHEHSSQETDFEVARPLNTIAKKKFNFRPEKDKDGNDIILPDGTKKKRQAVELEFNIPTVDGIKAALKDEKQSALIIGAVSELIFDAVRAQLADNVNITEQSELDVNKISLAYLANLPPSERGGNKIDKDTWEGFYTDFVDTMSIKVGLDKAKISAAGKVLAAKVTAARGKKKVLQVLENYLNQWFVASTESSNYTDVYEFLGNRIKNWLAVDEDELLAEIA